MRHPPDDPGPDASFDGYEFEPRGSRRLLSIAVMLVALLAALNGLAVWSLRP